MPMGRTSVIARISVLGAGLPLGFAGASLTTSCIFPDYCILVNTPGTDWCVLIEAQMWPIGQFELAEPVEDSFGATPKGCRCFNDGEGIILGQAAPAGKYEELLSLIREDARNECAWAVPPGYDHNCFEEGSLAPLFSTPFTGNSNTDC